MNDAKPDYFYSNLMGRIIFQAMEEIIGGNGTAAVLNLASLSGYIDAYPPHNQELAVPFEVISHTMTALEDLYGPHGGRGVALRIGRACFQHGLHEFGPLFGLTDLTFRLLPMQAKFKMGAEVFADIFNKHSDQRVRVDYDAKHIFWHIERCPMCWDRKTDAPCCHLAVGVLQEALYWVSGGKFFNVEETHCIACGDPECTIVIDKIPLS